METTPKNEKPPFHTLTPDEVKQRIDDHHVFLDPNIALASKGKCADFSGTDLCPHAAILRNARLRGANLQDCQLEGADMNGADLSEADLSGANLSRTILRGARLIIA